MIVTQSCLECLSPACPPWGDEGSGIGAVVLDARPEREHAAAHLVGSIDVPTGGRFAEAAGTVLPGDRDVSDLRGGWADRAAAAPAPS